MNLETTKEICQNDQSPPGCFLPMMSMGGGRWAVRTSYLVESTRWIAGTTLLHCQPLKDGKEWEIKISGRRARPQRETIWFFINPQEFVKYHRPFYPERWRKVFKWSWGCTRLLNITASSISRGLPPSSLMGHGNLRDLWIWLLPESISQGLLEKHNQQGISM